MKRAAELIREGKWHEAEQRLADLHRRNPFDAQVLFSLSYVLGEQGRLSEAVVALRQCLAAAPGFVQAMVNLSVLLMRTGDVQQAIRHAQMAVRSQPSDASLHFHLSLVWKAGGDLARSLEVVDNALGLKPRTPPWMLHRMRLLVSLKRESEACEEAERIRSIPGFSRNPEVLHVVDSFHAWRSDWKRLAEEDEQIIQALSHPQAAINPTAVMTLVDDPEILQRLGSRAATAYSALPRPIQNPASGKTCIAYFTADVREHPVAHMLLDVLPRHDRLHFEVVLVRLAPSDGSEVGGMVSSMFDREVDISRIPDGVAAQMLQEARIDVLIDVMGTTMGHRMDLLAMRPCPTQMLWLGCPTSTGCTHYDGFIVDAVVAPPDYERFCSEPLIRMPCCYHPISIGLGKEASPGMREAFSIPPDCVIVGILQQPNRIRPDFIERISRVLARHPEVHLLIRVKEESRDRARFMLQEWGVLRQNIHFLGRCAERGDYFGIMSTMDLLIDSHPYGGHSTVGEALSLGVPVLACCGRSIHSRVAASMMHEMGLADLIMQSPEQQSEMLDSLLSDSRLLGDWKHRFSSAASVPSEGRKIRLVRALEGICAEAISRPQDRLLPHRG